MWNTKIIDFIRTELHGNHAIFKETPFYRGDCSLRKANLTFDLTDDEHEKLAVLDDPQEFVKYLCPPVYPERYGSIKLRDYQVEFLNTLEMKRFVAVAKSRQLGFTMIGAILALQFASCNKDKTFMFITANGGAATEFIDRVKTFYSSLPFFMKPGIVSWNAKSLDFDNGCKIIAKGANQDIAVGGNIHFLYIDEAAFIKDIQKVFRSVGPMVLATKDSKIVVASTPNGYNWFYDLFSKAEEGANEFTPMRFKWNIIPSRDENWKRNEINNLGSEDEFNMQYELQWAAKNVVAVRITNEDMDQMLIDLPTKEWLMAEIKRLEENIKNLKDIANGRK